MASIYIFSQSRRISSYKWTRPMRYLARMWRMLLNTSIYMTNKKIFLFLILILGTIVFTYGKNLKRVSADEEITICPLSKMVTVGSLLDQSLISIDNLLLEADIILTNSSQAYQSASDLIKIGEEDCAPENCQSSCSLAALPGPALTSCTSGYTCSAPNILPGSDWTVSQINCVALPSGPIIIDP